MIMTESVTFGITGLGIISALGKSASMISRKLLSGNSAVSKFAFQAGAPELTVARIQPTVKTITPNRWPISRATALALEATRTLSSQNGTPAEPDPRLGLIHATAYGSLQSLLNYQSDLRRFGINRASPMQFPNTILHAAASFLSVSMGAAAFNITLSSEGLSGLDAIETACQLIMTGAADRVAVVTSEELSPELIPILETSDELDWRTPDPFGAKRAGYVPGEAAVAMMLEPVEQARAAGRKVYALLRGCSGFSSGPQTAETCEQALRKALDEAQLAPAEVGCVMASANGSQHDAAEADGIAATFGESVPVTSVKAAFGECAASGALLSIAAAIFCAGVGYYPPTIGRSKYDRELKPIQLLRAKSKARNPIFMVNAFSRNSGGSQIWQFMQKQGRA